MEYGVKWTVASYPKEDMMNTYEITSLRFIMKKGNYNLFECSNGRMVNIFADQINVLQLVKGNPYDLFAIGFLLPRSKYHAYSIDTDRGLLEVPTVARILPIMKGYEDDWRDILIVKDPNGGFQYLPFGK